MKEKIKSVLADCVYALYEKKILKNKIRVLSIDETLDELLKSEKSLVRFGDGEIIMIRGKSLYFQEKSAELSKRLAGILKYREEGLMVAIPDVLEGVSQYRESGQYFWKDHLLFFRSVYYENCRTDRPYGNAYVSRCYYNYADKALCERWFEKLKKIWEGKNIVVVEGGRTHNGVGNDLLNGALSVERIICPAENAFAVVKQIEEACLSYSLDKLFLVSLGAAAKPLVEDLFHKGYRVIDIGNLDMEYEWFLRKADQKIKLPKHEVLGKEANEKAGYFQYLSQVSAWITE